MTTVARNSIVACLLFIGVTRVFGAAEADLIEEGRQASPSERGALLNAAAEGQFDKLKTLLDAGGKVGVVDEAGRSLLHYSAGRGDVRPTELLLAAGASIDHADENGETPLMYAARSGRVEIVQLLLKHGARVDAVNNEGDTALGVAAASHRDDVVEVLAANGAQADIFSASVMPTANLLSQILKEYPQVVQRRRSNGDTALIWWVRHGRAEEVPRLLVEHGVEVEGENSDGETAMLVAVLGQQQQKRRLLGLVGAQEDLRVRATEDDVQGITQKLKAGVSQVELQKALVSAAGAGAKWATCMFLLAGADPDASIGSKKTSALMAAAKQDRAEVCAILLAHGALVDKKDENGETALHYASRSVAGSAAPVLLAAKANLDLLNNSGETAIHVAIKNGRRKTGYLLVLSGADLYARGHGIGTPISYVMSAAAEADGAHMLLRGDDGERYVKEAEQLRYLLEAKEN